MIYIEIFVVGCLIGFIAGLLVFRNNQRKFQDSEVKAKDIVEALKR
jgi:hypothetical protein